MSSNYTVVVVDVPLAEDGLGAETTAAPMEQPNQIQCSLGIADVLYDDVYSQLRAEGNTCGPNLAVLSSITMGADVQQASPLLQASGRPEFNADACLYSV